jgi:hypothetical protein
MLEWLKQRSIRAIVAVIVIVLVAGLAVSFPPDFALLMAVDLSTWVEAALAVYAATQVGRVRPVLMFLRAKMFGRLRASTRHARTRSLKKPDELSNDDEPVGGLAFAV